MRADDTLAWDDEQDWEDARRGFVARIDPPVVETDGGSIVWDLRPYAFLDEDVAPDTVNPSLWRQARLNMEHGLFRIHERIYQVRGYDLSVMSVVVGDTGYVVIDPLISAETARASMDLVRREIGDRPVRAVIYTHSHVDHFGGVKGVVAEEEADRGAVRVIAPIGLVEAAVSENVIAGNAMARRATYMYGNLIPVGPRGQVDAGLGKRTSTGTITLIRPNDVIGETGTVLTVDGVEIEFQLTPGTEAPAEMNFYFPAFRALCMAENCSHNLHNLYTPRGAEVRDAKAWAHYIDEAILRYGHRTDLVFTSHHWPTWGDQGTTYLAKQRDMYAYIHDQTMRLANHGLTMVEIAEEVALPPDLASEWYARGYYGTVNHDVKAVYQKYLGWFDGNPAHLHPHPPVEAARRYVEYMGGADAVLERARRSYEEGDYRWVAEVVNHVVFADPGNDAARHLAADALEQLGYQAESAVWRNFYLTGAQELRAGVRAGASPAVTASSDLVGALTLDLLLDALAVRLDGPRAAGRHLAINLHVTSTHETWAVWLEHGVLHHRADHALADPDVAVRAPMHAIRAVLLGGDPGPFLEAGELTFEGDPGVLVELAGLLDRFEFWFPIVEP